MGKYIPERLIEEVRLSSDIVDVVSEYVKLEKKGKYFFGLCPFHNEKTPSFSVTPSMQIYNCFGCNRGGNVFHFIMSIENLDFPEAVRFLADRSGIRFPSEEGIGNDDSQRAKLRYQILDINKAAARFFHENLNSPAGKAALEHLQNRGVITKTLRKFGLGYSLPDNNALYKYLLNKGFDKKIILESGIIIEGKYGGHIDRFRNRLMFPIFDIRNNVIGFGGRVLGSEIPKYMNSPETMVYDKGKELYGLNFAKTSGDGKLIIVEGYMDVLSLHQCGIINSVASLGTALTERQGRLLRKYAEETIIAFDADEAGRAATARSGELLSGLGCVVKVLTIPEGQDPEDFIKEKGPKKFKELVEKALGFVEYKIDNIEKEINIDNVEDKIKFINKVAEILSKLQSRVEMEIYCKKFAKEYGISERALSAEMIKHLSNQKNFRGVGSGLKKENIKDFKFKSVAGESKIYHAELLLLALLCMDNDLYKLIRDKININSFSGNNKEVAKEVFGRLDNNDGITPGELLDTMDTETAGKFARIIDKECYFEDNVKALNDIVNNMGLIKLRERKREILEILKYKENINNEDKKKLLEELNILVKELKVIRN